MTELPLCSNLSKIYVSDWNIVSTYPHRQVNGNTFVSLALRDGTTLMVLMISVAKLNYKDHSSGSKCSAITYLD